MHWFRRLAWRMEVLFRKGRAESELDEELEYHLEREIRENLEEGMTPEEARRKALVEFGGVERTKEQVRDVRGVRGLDDLRLDLRFILRRMGKSPAFFSAVILTLAVGIGATVAMFSVLDAALYRSQPYPEPDRLVLGRATFNGNVNPWASFPDYMDYRDGNDAFQVMAAYIPQIQSLPVTGSDTPEMAAASLVTVDFFQAMGVEPLAGRTFLADEAESSSSNVVVISHGFWQRWFGGVSDVVGRTLTLAGTPATVVGIMPPGFRYRSHTDVWFPVRHGEWGTENRRSHSWQAVGRVKDGVTLEQAQAQMDVISAQLTEAYPDTHENKGFRLTPLGEALAEGYRPALLVLMGATALLLFIACGNVAGLLMARATSRRVELSVRTALGARRQRLTRQLFTESLFLAVAAGGLGVILALWLQRIILALFPLDLLGIAEVGLSGPMLSFTLLVTLGTALLFGAGPALTASQANPSEDLRSSHRTSSGGKGSRMRGGLVAAQVALSVVLLTGSGLLIRSFVRLQTVDMGFQAESLLVARLSIEPLKYEDPVSRTQFFQGVLDDVRAMPEVVSASLIDKVPIRQSWTNWSCWDPENPPDATQGTPSAMARFVMPGYFDAMGVPILRGRDHDRGDVENSLPPVVINQVMADALFPDQDPVGRRLSVNMRMAEVREFEIVGVVGDMRITEVRRTPFFQMYFGYDAIPSNSMNLVVRAQRDVANLVPAIRRKIMEQDPDAPLTEVATMTDIVSASITGSRVLSLATSLFAVTALLLSMTGLYAVLAYYVSCRTREIGIRVAFGATAVHVMKSVLSRGLVLVAGGLAVGLGCAFGVTRLLQAQLYEVGVTDPVTFLGVGAALLVIGAVASLVPARRATRVDPVRAMQVE
ncbi:ADOP family duplicated permease [Gemmatimonadota bacterium]